MAGGGGRRCSGAACGGGRWVLPGPPRALLHRGSALQGRYSGTWQRCLRSTTPAARLSAGAFQHTFLTDCPPNPPNPLRPQLLFFVPSRVSAPKRKSLGGVGEQLDGRVGTHRRILQGGRDGNSQNEMRLPPGCLGSLGGGTAPATRGNVPTVFLPAPYCSHFARIRNLAQRKETGARCFGRLPAILLWHRAKLGSRCV